jgi:hypothetical protein
VLSDLEGRHCPSALASRATLQVNRFESTTTRLSASEHGLQSGVYIHLRHRDIGEDNIESRLLHVTYRV